MRLPPPGSACLLGLLFALSPGVRDASPATADGTAEAAVVAVPVPGIEGLRGDLLRFLNGARVAAGAPPLRGSAALERAAQQHADEVAAMGELVEESLSKETMERRLAAAGYDAHQWVESVLGATAPAGAAELIAIWHRDESAATYHHLLDSGYADVGVGIAYSERRGEVFLSVLAAMSRGEVFARDTAGLRDLARVRTDLLARINALRRRAGAPRLSANYHLDVAAQRHAEDMLARSYFAHRSPDGTSVRERAPAAGYDWSAIGENLAEGQRTLDQAVDGWMASPGHRENILDHRFTESGVGLALGRDPRNGEYRILWVQTFGSPP